MLANVFVLHILCGTHSHQSFFQLTVWDVAVLIHIHLFKCSQQISFFNFVFTFEDFTKVIKVKFWCCGSPVFIEGCIGGISTSLLKSLGKIGKEKNKTLPWQILERTSDFWWCEAIIHNYYTVTVQKHVFVYSFQRSNNQANCSITTVLPRHNCCLDDMFIKLDLNTDKYAALQLW